MSEKKIASAQFSTGAVRSADVDDFDFCSAPLLGVLGMLKVAADGGIKYGRHNYNKGMPVHVTLNHVAIHLIKYILGDRSEDHLSKVQWGAAVAAQTALLQPELADPYLLGPGATLTAELVAEMDKDKAERDTRREAGDFEELFNWTLGDIPVIKDILQKRAALAARRPSLSVHQIYGTPTRVESDHGEPTPLENETWVVYEDGTRAYFLRTPEPELVAEVVEVVKVKRKRRTKAQIAADKAAEEAAREAGHESTVLAELAEMTIDELAVAAVAPLPGQLDIAFDDDAE